jgi:hypothetical protein
MIGTAVMDFAGVRALIGKPCADCKPSKFKGYYKYEPVGADSCTALLLLSRWNTGAKKRDTVGYGKMVEYNAVSTYTPFEIPINYLESGSVDTMSLLIISSAGYNLVVFTASHGNPGSTMYVDDLTLDYPSGIQQVLMPEVLVNVYPNPANDFIHLDLTGEFKTGTVEILNAEGQQVGSFNLSKKANTIPVHDFPVGSYYFRLLSGKSLLNTGTFVVKR